MSNLTAPYYQEPPEAQSIKSMLHIARILAIIFGVLILLGGIAWAAYAAYLSSICATYVGIDPYCGGAILAAIIPAIWLAVSGLFLIVVYMQMKSIEAKVNARQYEQAKSQTLIWMILGFIFGILLGIILLIAYIKYDPLINAQRAAMGQAPPGGGYMPPPQGAPPAYGAPQPGYGAPAPPPPAPMPPQAPPAAAPASPFCSKCGKPTTYIAQYGRYYCYDDKLYV